jgi:hypothetical protein
MCVKSLSDIDRSIRAKSFDHLCRARPETIPLYFSEYTYGFSKSAVSHLTAPSRPRHEGHVGQAPRMYPFLAGVRYSWDDREQDDGALSRPRGDGSIASQVLLQAS